MEARTKLREERTALRELKEKIETLLREREYAKVVEEIEAFSQGYTPEDRDLDWAELQVRLAFAQEKLGRYDRKTAEAAYEALRLTDKRKEIGTIERILGREYLALGETKTGLKYLRNSLTEFDTIGDKKGKLETLNALGRACFISGRTREAIEHLTEALHLCHQNKGDKTQEAMLRGNLGACRIFTGQWPLASDMLRESLKLYEEIGDSLEIVKGLIALARLLIMQRNFDEAERLLQRAEALSQVYPRELAMTYESLGDLAKERSQFQKAKKYYQRTLEIGRRIAPQGDLINQVQRRRAELLIAEGKDLAQASACIKEALKVSQSLGDRFEEGCCYRTMGRLAQAKGNSKAAEANFEKAVEVLRSLEDRFELANTLLAQGELTGRDDPLREAQRLFAQIQGAEFYQALALLQIAKVEPSFKKAIETLEEVEKLLKGKGEAEKLEEVEALKLELNQRLKSFHNQKYQVLQGLSSEDLGKVFGRVIEAVEADRGFVAYRGNGRKEMEVGASCNLSEREVKGLLSLLADKDGFEVGSPFILYDSSLDKRFSSTGAYSIMVTPFGNGERIDGYLYVDRQRGKEPFLDKEFDLFYLLSERVAKAIAEQRQRELERTSQGLMQRLAVQGVVPEEIITQNEKMLEVLREADKVKDSKTAVLIQGESGTGKELVAQKVHFTSQRSSKKIIPINCGAIPDDLLEAELFGCERGAFTGAMPRKGLIEEANGGTLFLDEVGNLSLRHQAKLLRVLEEGKVRRVGGNEERRVDVRVIAATNKDLAEEIKKGRFREDLYYRLNTVVLDLPPLRERRNDIKLLAQYFLDIYSRKFKKNLRGITEEALKLLERYPWPGNVRELKNEMERAVLLADEGDELTPGHLSEEVKVSKRGRQTSGRPKGKRELTLEALEQNGWNKTRAAQSLGITRQGLIKRIKRFGLEKMEAQT